MIRNLDEISSGSSETSSDLGIVDVLDESIVFGPMQSNSFD